MPSGSPPPFARSIVGLAAHLLAFVAWMITARAGDAVASGRPGRQFLRRRDILSAILPPASDE
jgi:hypothetical protein